MTGRVWTLARLGVMVAELSRLTGVITGWRRARGAGGRVVTPTASERTCAALLHLCLALNMVTLVGGALAATLLAVVGPRATGYVQRQARQALAWQAQVWLATVAVALVMRLLCSGWLSLLIIPAELGLWAGAVFYALCAALLCLRGLPFRYWRR